MHNSCPINSVRGAGQKKKKKKKRQNIKRGCGREIQTDIKCNYLIKGRKGL